MTSDGISAITVTDNQTGKSATVSLDAPRLSCPHRSRPRFVPAGSQAAMTAEPIKFSLKRDDMPDDPQTLITDLLAVLRPTVDDALALRKAISTGVPNSRSIARSVEVFEGLARALDIAEALGPACRHRGLFSVDWSE